MPIENESMMSKKFGSVGPELCSVYSVYILYTDHTSELCKLCIPCTHGSHIKVQPSAVIVFTTAQNLVQRFTALEDLLVPKLNRSSAAIGFTWPGR